MYQLNPHDPQKTIDILIEICNNFDLYYGDDLYLKNNNTGKLLVKKWKNYYKQFETKKYGIMTWIADEHIDTKFYRWNKLQKISQCYYEVVSVR